MGKCELFRYRKRAFLIHLGVYACRLPSFHIFCIGRASHANRHHAYIFACITQLMNLSWKRLAAFVNLFFFFILFFFFWVQTLASIYHASLPKGVCYQWSQLSSREFFYYVELPSYWRIINRWTWIWVFVWPNFLIFFL